MGAGEEGAMIRISVPGLIAGATIEIISLQQSACESRAFRQTCGFFGPYTNLTAYLHFLYAECC
jgi:hypothetical protein